jgi:hypothetical protein
MRNIGCALKKQGNHHNAKERYISAVMIYRKALENWPLVNMVDENLMDLSLEELEGNLHRYERNVGKAHWSWPDILPS